MRARAWTHLVKAIASRCECGLKSAARVHHDLYMILQLIMILIMVLILMLILSLRIMKMILILILLRSQSRSCRPSHLGTCLDARGFGLSNFGCEHLLEGVSDAVWWTAFYDVSVWQAMAQQLRKTAWAR